MNEIHLKKNSKLKKENKKNKSINIKYIFIFDNIYIFL